MCIAVWTKEEEEETLSGMIESMSISDKVMFILYVANKYHHYYYDFPVNYLRNVCIRQITTSHFLFLDIDMWMTSTVLQAFVIFRGYVFPLITAPFIYFGRSDCYSGDSSSVFAIESSIETLS